MPQPVGLAARVVTDPGELELLRPAWLDLMRRGCNELMLSPDWLLTWWRIFGTQQGRRLRVILLEQEGRLVGLAPLLLRRSWFRRLVPMQRIEFLASGEREQDSICSPYLNVLVEPGLEELVADALARILVEGLAEPWHELVFTMMAGDQPMYRLLLEAFGRRGMLTHCEQTAVAPFIPLPGSWEEYLRRHNKSHRRFVVRALREFELWSGPDIRIDRATSTEELAEFQRILIDLHHQRWDAGGVFRSPRFLAFHSGMQTLMLRQNALDLRVLRVRGQPVAAMYSIIWHGKVYYYQCGRRVDLPPKVRPGIYLLARAIRDHIEAGRREFDFLPGAAQYKMELAQAVRPVVEVRVARPGPRESLRRLLERAVAWARQVRGWRQTTDLVE